MRKEYFSFIEKSKEFDKALMELISNVSRKKREAFISSENIMRYSHGTKWISVSSDGSKEENEMNVHSTETSINMSDIRGHNLKLLPSFINSIITGFDAQFSRTMYQTISDTCEKSGNVVNRKNHTNFSETFLETLKTIQFGVDKNGNVSLPQIHSSPAGVEKMMKDLEGAGEEFKKNVDKVIEQKSSEPLEREQARLSRFKNNG